MRPKEQASDPVGRKRTSQREAEKKSDHDGTRAYSILTRSTTGKFPRNLQTKIVHIDDFPLTPPNDGGANLASRCRPEIVISHLRRTAFRILTTKEIQHDPLAESRLRSEE